MTITYTLENLVHFLVEERTEMHGQYIDGAPQTKNVPELEGLKQSWTYLPDRQALFNFEEGGV